MTDSFLQEEQEDNQQEFGTSTPAEPITNDPRFDQTYGQPLGEVMPQTYPAPFGNKIGQSSIDLSKEQNEDKMLEEYNTWFHAPKGDERNKLREDFHRKYYGLSFDDFKEQQQAVVNNSDMFNPFKRLDNVFRRMSIPGISMADFVMDAAGTVIPGFNKVDDRWDEVTKLDSPTEQKVRNVMSIILPSIYTGNVATGALGKAGLLSKSIPWYQRMLAATGAYGLTDAAVIGLSDIGEEDNLMRTMADTFPTVFGPKGRVPIPDSIKTLDSDSPSVRKQKNMYEAGPFAFMGTMLGAFIDLKGGKSVMGWMNPLDETAKNYKQLEISLGADNDKLIKLQEINEVLSTKALSRQNENILINEKLNLENELGIIDSVDDVFRRSDISAAEESRLAAERKLTNPDQLELDFGPDIDLSPGVVDESASARQIPPPGNVARNMADTTAIKQGTSEGDPAPVITEAMRKKGLMVGPTSRGAVMGLAEAARMTGRFDAVVDGVRISAKEMNAAAWGIYNDIINPEATVDDVRKLFMEDRDVKNLMLGKYKIEVINEDQARAAAFAMRDLVDRFLGREVTKSSARAMDTIGREAATMAEAITEIAPYTDEAYTMDNILDKLQFLMDEYGLNKYLSGWSLRNKNWFDQVPPKDIDEGLETLLNEFQLAENSIHAKNKRFTKTLKELKKKNPAALRPLVDAFAHTNGDVDTLAKLMKWSADQITPLGMIKSPDPKQLNLFARSAWSVVYNNVLSGLSAFRAGIGNGAQLILKPITAVLGHGFYGPLDGFEGLKRTFYYNGAVFETNRRALTDAFTMMKKAHKDPDAMIKAYRKDFVFKGEKAWDIMDQMRPVYEKEGNWGRLMQLDLARLMKQMGQAPMMRYGMTGMVFPDVFTSTHLAHNLSRVRAYDDVFSEFGYADMTKIFDAEKKHYANFFDADGLIKDKVLRNVAGEVQLNLDDGLANWINQGTNAYPFVKFLMMFPRTSSNYIKNALSWTPISLIPGINKYSKTIYARTDDDIAAALMEHGIDMATDPYAKVLWENLRAEYTGRLAFSALLTKTLWDYAVAGNIRGNGHYNASRRNKERTQMGYEPKTVRIGNQWVNYKGIIGVEHVLTILGDMAYYMNDLDESLFQNWTSKLTWTIAATFLNETPLQGLEPLISVTNGDLTGWSRLTANTLRSFLPLSGGAGVTSNAITSSQKDIEAEVDQYIKNRLPFFSSQLPEQVDIWTGEPVNDIDNPVLRVLNAISPIQVSGTAEPWRQWLLETGWDGLAMLNKDSTGSYEYTPQERELINKYIGEQQMWKQLDRLRKSKRYAEEIRMLKLHRSTNADFKNDRIKIQTKKLPIFKEINNIVRNAQKQAELRLLRERPDIANVVLTQQAVDQAMSEGNIQGAAELQKKDLDTQNLLNMSK